MDFVIVGVSALVAALLTLFSGFGLGTLLLPVLALFFALEVAVAATAVVHLANNIFKVALLGRHARAGVVARFGIPAVLFSFAGAWVLTRLAHTTPITTWEAGGRIAAVTPLGLVLGGLIAVFAALELLPALEHLSFAPGWLPAGGALSGFFGGLSGHQGALRAAFLAKSGLDRDGFLGTSVVCAVLVDLARLTVYGTSLMGEHLRAALGPERSALLVVATLAAFVGSFVGTRLVRKVTLRGLQRFIGVMLLVLAVAIAAGLV